MPGMRDTERPLLSVGVQVMAATAKHLMHIEKEIRLMRKMMEAYLHYLNEKGASPAEFR